MVLGEFPGEVLAERRQRDVEVPELRDVVVAEPGVEPAQVPFNLAGRNEMVRPMSRSYVTGTGERRNTVSASFPKKAVQCPPVTADDYCNKVLRSLDDRFRRVSPRDVCRYLRIKLTCNIACTLKSR